MNNDLEIETHTKTKVRTHRHNNKHARSEREIIPPFPDQSSRKLAPSPTSLQTNKSTTQVTKCAQFSEKINQTTKIFWSKPAVSFKFVKLPDEIESEAGREENEKLFAVPVADPAKDLNWSKLFMLGNPSFCIFEIVDWLQLWNPKNSLSLSLALSWTLLSSGFSVCSWNDLGAKAMRLYSNRVVHVYYHVRHIDG